MPYYEFGVKTKADAQYKSEYNYSEENNVVKEEMTKSLSLDCGHGHMGIHWKCSSCRKSMWELLFCYGITI